ncbi:YutD family protein [Paenibacillus sp. GSMTC-2017]|nr:YutD family protein [Paenibacillus sp. GSMTC-2017]
MIHIGGKSYELIHENRSGWNPEAFRNRFSEVLERYDYIIGDWGYNQLRLKGFFKDNHQKATKESTFSAVSDYINEYCNFGCAYFILEKQSGGRRETTEDDMDLDLDLSDEVVRLEGFDLRAAAESAASATSEIISSEDEVKPPQRELIFSSSRHRSTSNKNSERSAEDQSKPATNEGRRRDQNYRGKNHRGGNDTKGKKPIKLAANEAAATSEPTRSHTNKKDAGRS